LTIDANAVQVSDDHITESSSVVPHLFNEDNLMVFVDVVCSAVKKLRACKYSVTMLVNFHPILFQLFLCGWSSYLSHLSLVLVSCAQGNEIVKYTCIEEILFLFILP